MKELSKTIGTMAYDGLVTDLTPAVQVRGGTAKQISLAATYKRGTLLGKGNDNKLVIYNGAESTAVKPYCILVDDTEISAEGTTNVTVYTAGCFDPNKIIVASEYHMTEADYDELRRNGIVFKAASSAV